MSGILLASVLAMVHLDAPEVRGLRSWILACAGLSIGLGIRQRTATSDPFIVFLAGNLLLNTGPVLIWHGVRRFARLNAPRWPIVATAAFSIVWSWWFGAAMPSQRARIVAFCLLIGGWCFAAAREFWRLPDRSMRLGRALTTTPLLLFAVVLMLRAAYTASHPDIGGAQAIAGGNETDGITYLVGGLSLLALMVGILACVNGNRTAEVRRLAFEDALTGALSRRGLYTGLPSWLARHAAGSTVTLVDLDYFKRVNDTLGHAAGDELLQLLVSSCRAQLPPDALLARIGGDEFVFVLPAGHVAETVMIAARERFASEIAARLDLAGVTPPLGMSCGTAPLPGADVTAFDEALRRADRALYGEKTQRSASLTPEEHALVAAREAPPGRLRQRL